MKMIWKLIGIVTPVVIALAGGFLGNPFLAMGGVIVFASVMKIVVDGDME